MTPSGILWLLVAGPALWPTSLEELPVFTPPRDPLRSDYLLRSERHPAGVYRGAEGRTLILDNGLVSRVFVLEPGFACIDLVERRGGQRILRAVRPEARVTIDGTRFDIGGLEGQPDQAYLIDAWLATMTAPAAAWHLRSFEVSEPVERFAWDRRRHHAPGARWPPPGVALRLDFGLPAALAAEHPSLAQVTVSVHYELYDDVPVFSKWLRIHNAGTTAVTVDRFCAEILAVVEQSNWVETREGVPLPRPDAIHVETDFAFGGFQSENANRHAVHWRPDPTYTTQVNYRLQTPCLLEVEPTYGPAQEVAPGGSFESFRVFELVFDGGDRERRSLALRRMYRTIAPWVTENPLMHHMRLSDPDAVRAAIDQAAEVGFEMLILSFGSGFNIENEEPAYLQQWREVADHARNRGVEIGGYSLLASRSVGGGNDVVSPEGEQPTFGSCPALTSPWGQDYFRKLYAFFEQTGFSLLEHDGPYPGDVDVTPRPPWQKGEQDSRWAQWRIARDFYRWCRARGVYVNAPDFYYLSGTSKCGMGYREVNWSLPRAQQVIHTRQNIYDGTWTKTPSMGWMFVPLSEYHGGGAAATIEPLHEHQEHYGRMLASNLAFGVQACYRGPRLFDSEETKQLVKSSVDWYREHRDILESDLVHGRRADGRDLDWMLHVNPDLDEQGMLVVFNPLLEECTRRIDVDLYYTGLQGSIEWEDARGVVERVEQGEGCVVPLEITVPAQGFHWIVFRRADR